jgi:hypothetical protein
MVEWCRQGKLLIRPPQHSLASLPAEPSSSRSRRSGRRKWWILSMKYLFMLAVLFKILRHGTDGFNFLPKETCCRCLSLLKNSSLRPSFNPRTLSPMASTLTITPSWTQFSGYGCDKRRTILCRTVKMYKKSRHTRSSQNSSIFARVLRKTPIPYCCKCNKDNLGSARGKGSSVGFQTSSSWVQACALNREAE